MRRRKRLVVLAGLAVVLCAAGAVALWPREGSADRVTRENYDRLRKGMTHAEVQAILGPPGDYRTGPTLPEFSEGDALHLSAFTQFIWQGDDGAIFVDIFKYDGKMFWFQFVPVQKMKQGPIDNLLWRVKRPWRKWFPE